MVENPIIVGKKRYRIRVYPRFDKINSNFWNLIFLRVIEMDNKMLRLKYK